jgi:hypothetical protein
VLAMVSFWNPDFETKPDMIHRLSIQIKALD